MLKVLYGIFSLRNLTNILVESHLGLLVKTHSQVKLNSKIIWVASGKAL